MSESETGKTEAREEGSRRGFLGYGSGVLMGGGLACAYGTLGVMAGRFLFPSASAASGWQFVAPAAEFRVGDSRPFVSPSGARVVIARQAEADEPSSFIALSSVCPHLGCQVHWEPQHNRFFCPCHNGVFDPQGNPREGPPAAAGQPLTRFPMKIEDGMLFVEVPVTSVTDVGSA